jgi:hypothetical protein
MGLAMFEAYASVLPESTLMPSVEPALNVALVRSVSRSSAVHCPAPPALTESVPPLFTTTCPGAL